VAAVTDGGHGGSRVARFLAARLARLAAAADYVVTAARDGNAVALRQHLRRFDALTSALWTVLPDVCDVGSQRPCRGSPARPVPKEEDWEPGVTAGVHAPTPRWEQDKHPIQLPEAGASPQALTGPELWRPSGSQPAPRRLA